MNSSPWSYRNSLRRTSIFRSQGSIPENLRTSSPFLTRSEEHTSELQSLRHLVCRLLLDPPHTEIYTLSLHDALPIYRNSLRRTSIFRSQGSIPENLRTSSPFLTKTSKPTSLRHYQRIPCPGRETCGWPAIGGTNTGSSARTRPARKPSRACWVIANPS